MHAAPRRPTLTSRTAVLRPSSHVPPLQDLSNLAEIIKYMKFAKDFKLDATRRKMLCHNMRMRSYRVPYKRVFSQGDVGNAFFVVAVGRVSIQVYNEQERATKVRYPFTGLVASTHSPATIRLVWLVRFRLWHRWVLGPALGRWRFGVKPRRALQAP